MELYNLKKNKLEKVSLIPFKLEKDIQALVEKSTDTIFQLEFIESEFKVEKYRIDTLCLDVENNSVLKIHSVGVCKNPRVSCDGKVRLAQTGRQSGGGRGAARGHELDDSAGQTNNLLGSASVAAPPHRISADWSTS